MKHYVITFVKYNGQPPYCVLLTLQIYYFFLNQQKYYHKKNYLSSKTRVFQTY